MRADDGGIGGVGEGGIGVLMPELNSFVTCYI